MKGHSSLDIVVAGDGLWSDRQVQELATWYTSEDPETFEAHLMMLRAYASLFTSAQRGRRTAISIERYSLLRLLHHAPGNRLLMSEISRALHVSPTSVTKLVNALSRDGLVRRLNDPDDRRRAWAEITASGTGVLLDNLPGMRSFTRSRWSGLDKQEKRQLAHLLAKLVYTIQTGPEPLDLIMTTTDAAAPD